MGLHVNVEYSVFDVQNPFAGRSPEREETYTDSYLYLSPKASLKLRDNHKVKYKVLLRSFENSEMYQHIEFPNDPRQDPLRSFLHCHRFTDLFETPPDPRLVIPKQRVMYSTEGNVKVYFSTFTFQGESRTNLTLSARRSESIHRLQDRLQLTERNKSFTAFLLQYVHPE